MLYDRSAIKKLKTQNSITMPQMTDQRFAGSHIKLGRALKFIDELERELQKYDQIAITSLSYVMVNGAPMIRLDWAALPLEAGAILGDAIHNMRTSLDLMASELARINSRSDKNVYFPFADSQENLNEQMTKKKFPNAGEDAVALLREYRPYKGGNLKLRAIHDLDLRDKHRVLLETEKLLNVEVRGSYDETDPMNGSIELGNVVIEHRFAPEYSLAGSPIITTLKEMVQIVQEILTAFDSLVSERKRAC